MISREDLDRFAAAFAPNLPATGRGRLAVQYARSIAFAALAEQQNLSKNPVLAKEVERQLELVRIRILASTFLQSLQSQTTTVLGSEIERYYGKHKKEYEQAQLLRLAVPILAPNQSGRPLERSIVKTEMETLRKRAVAGEDFSILQRDAYMDLHIQAQPPPVTPVAVRRNSLQGDEAGTFDLNPGEISDILDLPGAVALVKLQAKDVLALESVRQEIEVALRRDHMQAQLTRLNEKVKADFNLNYLGLSSQPDLFGTAAISPVVNDQAVRQKSTDRP